jgi:hypothetical protein
VGQNAAVQIAAKLPLHERRYRMTAPILFARQREVGLQVLLDDVVQGGVLGAATGVRDGSTSLRGGGHVGVRAGSTGDTV